MQKGDRYGTQRVEMRLLTFSHPMTDTHTGVIMTIIGSIYSENGQSAAGESGQSGHWVYHCSRLATVFAPFAHLSLIASLLSFVSASFVQHRFVVPVYKQIHSTRNVIYGFHFANCGLSAIARLREMTSFLLLLSI